MVWVRSEYAGELAVVCAWLAALVPWNVTYSSAELQGALLAVRFPFFEVQYFVGFEIDGRGFFLLPITDAVAQQAGQTVYGAYLAWAVGAVLVAAAVLYAFAYYFAEERVETGPVDPVLAIGCLLGSAGTVLLVTNGLLVQWGIPGIPIPVGSLLLLAMGAVLVRAERR